MTFDSAEGGQFMHSMIAGISVGSFVASSATAFYVYLAVCYWRACIMVAPRAGLSVRLAVYLLIVPPATLSPFMSEQKYWVGGVIDGLFMLVLGLVYLAVGHRTWEGVTGWAWRRPCLFCVRAPLVLFAGLLVTWWTTVAMGLCIGMAHNAVVT